MIRLGGMPLWFQSVDGKPIKKAGHPARRLELRLDGIWLGFSWMGGACLSLVNASKKAHLFIGVCVPDVSKYRTIVSLPLFVLSSPLSSITTIEE